MVSSLKSAGHLQHPQDLPRRLSFERHRQAAGERRLQPVERRIEDRTQRPRFHALISIDRRLVMLPVQKRLSNERDDTHQRGGIAVAARALRERDVQRDRRADDDEAAARIGDGADLRILFGRRDVHERAPALDDFTRRRREHGGNADRRERREAGHVGADVLRRLELRPQYVLPLPALGLLRRRSSGACARGSSMPAVVPMSMRPGYTVRPAPSMTRASEGTATSAPTASTSPPRRTMVPDAMGAPAAVTIRAPRMAVANGAWARGAATTKAAVRAALVKRR